MPNILDEHTVHFIVVYSKCILIDIYERVRDERLSSFQYCWALFLYNPWRLYTVAARYFFFVRAVTYPPLCQHSSSIMCIYSIYNMLFTFLPMMPNWAPSAYAFSPQSMWHYDLFFTCCCCCVWYVENGCLCVRINTIIFVFHRTFTYIFVCAHSNHFAIADTIRKLCDGDRRRRRRQRQRRQVKIGVYAHDKHTNILSHIRL